MTLTEKDAKFRFCPLLTTPDGKLRFCQGSQCMMWRWLEESAGQDRGSCGLAVASAASARAGLGAVSSAPSGKAENPFG
jgi:hypothetical protein